MKRSIMTLLLLLALSLGASAQSSMSDDQVIKFVLKEQKAGSSQQEIVTKLMQKGVDIEQIRRVKKKAERLQKDQALGQVKSKNLSEEEQIDERLRQNNGDKRRIENSSTEKLKDDKLRSQRKNQKNKYKKYNIDEEEERNSMKAELDDFLPDSLDLYDRKVIKDYLRQKDIEEGKPKKKVFGRDIFNNEDLSFEPNMNIATPEDYVLGAGDAVFVDVYGASQKSEECTVTPDGYINIEDFGPISVAGLTVKQANQRVKAQLGRRYSSSQIRLSVGQTRTIVVNVMGEVKMPGTYTLSAFSSVFHALYMAGGPNDIGTLRDIKVYRNNKLVSTVDVYDYILNGKLSGNVKLGENDVIVVGSYQELVNITGKVKRPMFYEMKKDESLATLLDYAGGFTGDAYKKSVRVTRKSGAQYSVYNVNEFDLGSFFLSDEDSVSVDSILPRYSNMAEVKGAVFRPGKYEIGKNISSVKTLLEACEGVTEDAFTAHAVMHRMKTDRTLEVVSVDIDGILSGSVADIPLKNEDVLFVPTRQDVHVQQTISIHGEVMYPGTYKYADNETLEDFVLQAGGLKETASMVNVFVSRRVTNPHATQTDSIIAQTFTFALKDGFVIDGEQSFHLMPFDEVYVRQSPGYYKQQDVTVEGEVMFRGAYTLSSKNERLSDVMRKAGGPTDMAYVEGARLERRYNEAERMRMEEALKKTKEEQARLLQEMALASGRSIADLNISKLEEQEKKDEDEIGDTYFVAIQLDKAIAKPGSTYDIQLREGDRIIVPSRNETVKISGEVMHPNTVAFRPGKKAKYYINQAGGYGNQAKKSQAYVIYMNGSVTKVNDWAKVEPGCEIVVPAKAQAKKMSVAEYLTIGSTAASIATMIATLSTIIK